MVNVRRVHIRWMKTMNMHNPVLMQSWKQFWKDDDHDEFCGGANSYKITDGKVVFLTQAESYHHRGPAFARYSQLEFECIIQLQEKVQRQEKAELSIKSSKDCVNQDQHFPWE